MISPLIVGDTDHPLNSIPKLLFSAAMALSLTASVEPLRANDSSPMIREFAG